MCALTGGQGAPHDGGGQGILTDASDLYSPSVSVRSPAKTCQMWAGDVTNLLNQLDRLCPGAAPSLSQVPTVSGLSFCNLFGGLSWETPSGTPIQRCPAGCTCSPHALSGEWPGQSHPPLPTTWTPPPLSHTELETCLSCKTETSFFYGRTFTSIQSLKVCI